jgi:hypothetical protein
LGLVMLGLASILQHCRAFCNINVILKSEDGSGWGRSRNPHSRSGTVKSCFEFPQVHRWTDAAIILAVNHLFRHRFQNTYLECQDDKVDTSIVSMTQWCCM